MDKLKPVYDILNKAGSRLGTQQSEEIKILQKMALKGRVYSKESV